MHSLDDCNGITAVVPAGKSPFGHDENLKCTRWVFVGPAAMTQRQCIACNSKRQHWKRKRVAVIAAGNCSDQTLPMMVSDVRGPFAVRKIVLQLDVACPLRAQCNHVFVLRLKHGLDAPRDLSCELNVNSMSIINIGETTNKGVLKDA